MIQEFLVISPRGDTLIAKNYVGTVNRSTADTFLRMAKGKGVQWGSSPPPVFQFEGVTYCYVQTNQMYFVVTTLKNCQAATLIELLQRLSRVFKVSPSPLPPCAVFPTPVPLTWPFVASLSHGGMTCVADAFLAGLPRGSDGGERAAQLPPSLRAARRGV